MSLSAEKIAALLATPKSSTGRGNRKRGRFQLTDESPTGTWVEGDANSTFNSFDGTTHFCAGCGHCEYPGMCAFSITCPECGSPPTVHCRDHGRLVSFHRERWKAWPKPKEVYVGDKTTVSEAQLIYKQLMKMGVIHSDGS